MKSSLIRALIVILFASFISVGSLSTSSFAQQKDGDKKEKIERPGEKPLPKHKGGKRKHKRHRKHNKHHKRHKHHKHHKHGKKKNKKNKPNK